MNYATGDTLQTRTKPQTSFKNLSWLLLYLFVFFIVLIKFITFKEYRADLLFTLYSLTVSLYILVRLVLSYFYEPEESRFDYSYKPTVTVVIPAKDEEENIYETIVKVVDSVYPKHLLEVIAINDGSNDNTLDRMKLAQKYARAQGVRLQIINWRKNRGKRAGMAAGVKKCKSEIVVFVDSDSFVSKNALNELIKYFPIDEKIGASTAHTHVYNSDNNFLTKIQTIHYYISFKIFKGAESLFATVTCCPGCCTAYRTAYIKKDIDKFENQKFLGVKCTYGDDRSLTNMLLKKGYSAVYSPTSHAHTVAPDTLKKFLNQQLRWKKSWVRETLLGAKFFWRLNPVMIFLFYTGMLLTFLTPLIVFRALVWYPIVYQTIPISYLIGLFLMSGVFSVYYNLHTGDKKWYYGLFYSFFYSLFLSWQMFYAIPTLKDQKWGTR